MPKRLGVAFFLAASLAVVLAQGPVVLQRGVLNPVTLEPAPSRVAPGDLLAVRGLNLGSAESVTAPVAGPLPLLLGGVQAFVNNRPAPIASVAPDQVVLQVPVSLPAGLFPVVIQRGELRSPPALVRVVAVAPAIRTQNNRGFGAAGTQNGETLTLPVAGLGLTDPPAAAGETAGGDTPLVPRALVRAAVGGLPAEVKAALSKTRVGEFDVQVTVPQGAQPGDVVTVTAGGGPVNRATLGTSPAEAQVKYQRLPAALRDVRVLRQSDLRGTYVTLNGPRDADGCFPTWVFDMTAGTSSRVEPCLIAQPQQNVATPVNPVNESHLLAAFAGPASDQPNLLSSKVVLLNPARDAAMQVDLPGPAAFLGSQPDGTLIAIGGTAAYSIDPSSGEVREIALGGGGVGGGQGGGAPGGAPVGAIFGLQVDLGDGLNIVLTPPSNVGQGALAVVVGDHADKPTKAKLALITAGSVSGTRDFPAGWLPLVPPAQAAAPGAPAPLPGFPAGIGFRVPVFFDATSRTLLVLARKDDNSAHGLVAFTGADLAPKELAFPSGWFAATCSPNIALFSLELSRRLALFGARRPADAVNARCPAQGYLSLDLASQQFRAVPLPGVGEANTRTPSGDVNDYLYSTNSDSQNVNLSDTLYVYDSVAGSPFRLDLPSGILAFQQLTPVPQWHGLMATAVARTVPGDGGLVFFDLETEKTTVFPVPEGFQTVNFVAAFPVTRKIVARGNKADGSQFLIFDVDSGNLIVAPNPQGVAWVGVLPAAPGGAPGGGGGGVPGGGGQGGAPGGVQIQGQAVSAKSNVIAAIGFDANRNPAGILTIKVP